LVFTNENSCRGFGSDDFDDGVGVVVPALDVVVVLWHVVESFFCLPSQTRQFSKVQFPAVFGFWIFQFTESPSQLPKIRPIANLLSSKLLLWKLENPKLSQSPKILPIHPKISQFPMPLPKSNVQSPKLSNLKGTKPDRHNYYYLDNKNKMAYLNLSTVESFKII
jgi:hypothetical protein